MSLFEIQKGKKREPFNVILAGVAGIGKSTWAAGAPLPLFIGAEETGEIDIARFPQPKSYNDFVAQVEHLLIPNCNIEYQTIVVDTLDSIEKLLHEKILSEDPKQTGSMIAAHGGYGKAYEKAEHELISLRSKFKRLRDEKGKNLIFIAHTKKTIATDVIQGLSYDTYELNLHQRAQAVFVDWSSAVLFANYIVHAAAGTNTDKIFAMGDGERVLLTSKRPGHIGKNRFDLPYEMPLNFSVFHQAYENFFNGESTPTSTDEIRLSIIGLCKNIEDDERVKKIMNQVELAGSDIKKLKKIKDKVEEIVG